MTFYCLFKGEIICLDYILHNDTKPTKNDISSFIYFHTILTILIKLTTDLQLAILSLYVSQALKVG